MWRTVIKVSYWQLFGFSCFYLVLICTVIIQFHHSQFDVIAALCCLLLVIDAFRCSCLFLKIKGEFAMFHYLDQIYWNNQRWHVICKPLLFRYAVILNLKSCRNGKRQTLFLVSESFNRDDWRTLHYWLRHQLHLTE